MRTFLEPQGAGRLHFDPSNFEASICYRDRELDTEVVDLGYGWHLDEFLDALTEVEAEERFDLLYFEVEGRRIDAGGTDGR